MKFIKCVLLISFFNCDLFGADIERNQKSLQTDTVNRRLLDWEQAPNKRLLLHVRRLYHQQPADVIMAKLKQAYEDIETLRMPDLKK